MNTKRMMSSRASALVGLVVAATSVSSAVGQERQQWTVVPEGTSETAIVRELKQLREDTRLNRDSRCYRILDYSDALLQRFPDSDFKDDAQLLKLMAFAGLAQNNTHYFHELLILTEAIECEEPSERLAAENAYFAIVAFVLGARLENMPEERRLLGTRERYEAFLEDHPDSSRASAIAASLVRNLLAEQKVPQAQERIRWLREHHPHNPATIRAEGELFRVTAVGKPFHLDQETSGGSKLDTKDNAGSVVVLYFWSAWKQRATAELPTLLKLHKELGSKGLHVIGINLDRDRKRADGVIKEKGLAWPQFFEPRGFYSELATKLGIIRVPTYFLIDRQGVLRSTDPGTHLEELVRALVAGPAEPATPAPEAVGDVAQPVKP